MKTDAKNYKLIELIAQLRDHWSAPRFDCSPSGRKMRREAPWGEHRRKADGRRVFSRVQADHGPTDSDRGEDAGRAQP
jgi:hypothetical protein